MTCIEYRGLLCAKHTLSSGRVLLQQAEFAEPPLDDRPCEPLDARLAGLPVTLDPPAHRGVLLADGVHVRVAVVRDVDQVALHPEQPFDDRAPHAVVREARAVRCGRPNQPPDRRLPFEVRRPAAAARRAA